MAVVLRSGWISDFPVPDNNFGSMLLQVLHMLQKILPLLHFVLLPHAERPGYCELKELA